MSNMNRICLAAVGLSAIGCTVAELKDAGANVSSAASDAVAAVAADPSKAFTPEGLAVIASVFVAGFFAKQGASVGKSLASGTGGLLVKAIGKITGLFKKE